MRHESDVEAAPDDMLKQQLQICERCERYDESVQRRRQNTAYIDDESNFRTLCSECQAIEDEHWNDMWHEYYSGKL